MYYAYVLKSISHDYFYKGHCLNLDKRLQQHNSGMTQSLRPYIPLKIVYFEVFDNEADAIAREKFFKTPRGRSYLKAKLVP